MPNLKKGAIAERMLRSNPKPLSPKEQQELTKRRQKIRKEKSKMV